MKAASLHTRQTAPLPSGSAGSVQLAAECPRNQSLGVAQGSQVTPIYQVMATDDDEGAGKDVWMDVTKEVFDDLKQRHDIRYRILRPDYAAQTPAAPVDSCTGLCKDGSGEGCNCGPAAHSRLSADTDDDWKEDPSADERWQAGCDFAMVQLCHALGVDPKSVRWDAATETLDGDVNEVIWNILRAKMGEDWDPDAQPQPPCKTGGAS